MITVAAASNIIQEAVQPLAPVQLSLAEAAGLVLAADVYATQDIPAFAQSSMDGYALSFEGWRSNDQLFIKGEIPAGFGETISFDAATAVRIFTGAPVPDGADTVVMQEKTNVENGRLLISDENLSQGMNVRSKGSEIKTGERAVPAGTYLSPAAIGFLAGIGIIHVQAYPKPTITLIVTGKELQQPGLPLQPGQVYESNSATLMAALAQLHIHKVSVLSADDDLDILTGILQSALEQSDIVLLTGGVSVGDYDFVLEAAQNCGIRQMFHRIKQRPGKPLFFGKKQDQLIFGLPGNPSSVLTCFYEYVVPALKLASNQTGGLTKLQAKLAKDFKKTAGLTHFLKGFYDGENAATLEAQESYRLSSFAKANCLIKIEEDITHHSAGDMVEIHLLPG